jgi:DNA (cytosine-5)-methyltransferase 1
MNHREKLLELYQNSKVLHSHSSLPNDVQEDIKIISENCFKQKGVFTVVITLAIHKILYSEQDIRFHQSNMKNGFSGRSIDTKYITPTLKELGLPSMAESGWLTRSLEQPYPYDANYNGKISDIKVKSAFLKTVDFIQNNQEMVSDLMLNLFSIIRKKVLENKVQITPLHSPERLNIDDVIKLLENHFSYNYKTHGGSKLPVIAFFAVFKSIINEVSRYKNCYLGELGSHTASDLTSNSSGDIEIYDVDRKLIEAIEIKHNKPIDINVVRVAVEKIHKFNPIRYCIFSFHSVKNDDLEEITKIIKSVELEHGCQIIVNGVIPTLKYYLRLISSVSDFVENYRIGVEGDKELTKIHKDKLVELFREINLK